MYHMDYVAPVSYTHLDVYKRQPVLMRCFTREPPLSGLPKLQKQLYTHVTTLTSDFERLSRDLVAAPQVLLTIVKCKKPCVFVESFRVPTKQSKFFPTLYCSLSNNLVAIIYHSNGNVSSFIAYWFYYDFYRLGETVTCLLYTSRCV